MSTVHHPVLPRNATGAEIRAHLLAHGYAIVRVHEEGSEAQLNILTLLRELGANLRPSGGTPHSAKSMAGLVKMYGAAAWTLPIRVAVRFVYERIYETNELSVSWDAPIILDPRDAGFGASKLVPHVDWNPGVKEKSAQIEAFPHIVQGIYAAHEFHHRGATTILAVGPYDGDPDTRHFDISPRSHFSRITEEGLAFYENRWERMHVPAGCLLLWLSTTPHHSTLASFGHDYRGRYGQCVCYAPKVLSDEATRSRRFEKMIGGATMEHLPYEVGKAQRGSHYSNGQGLTRVLPPPRFTEHELEWIRENV